MTTVSFRLPASGDLKLYVRAYGSPDAGSPPVLCLAGLTRNGKDFEAIARHMANRHYVLALDARGRGRSGYDADHRNYNLQVETADAIRVIELLLKRPALIIGTSRGGLQAMLMANLRPDLLAGVVLNDIGPEIMPEGIERIMGYLGQETPETLTWEGAAALLQMAYSADFSNLKAEDWQRLARQIFRDEDGRPVTDYDLRLREAVLEQNATPDLWPMFEALRGIPALVVRGANSDILSSETVRKMHSRHPELRSVTVPDRGHVPFLDEPEALEAIDAFLAELAS